MKVQAFANLNLGNVGHKKHARPTAAIGGEPDSLTTESR